MNKDKIIENFGIPMVITFSVLLFLPGRNFFIFGQDSLTGLGLFTFSENPLYSFNNAIPLVYFSLLSNFVNRLLHNPVASQDILIIIGSYISIAGLFDLIDVVTQLPKRTERVVSKSLGALFFLYNPFTLSVTWWHFESWSILILLSPFIISFLTDTVYNGGNLKRFSLTALISIVFVVAISGPTYPFFLLTVGIFIIFLIYFAIINIHNRPVFFSMLRRVGYILAYVVLTTLWAFIPIYLSTFRMTTAPLTGSFLIRFFSSESATTTLPNVLSLTGFSWIYEVPNAYPWINLFPAIQATAFLLLFFIPITPIILKQYNKLTPLTMVALLAIIFSTGSNFPFGIINKNLLFLRGPFLFLINPYYWVLQFYVLFLALLLSLVFYRSISVTKHTDDSAIKHNVRNMVRRLRSNHLKVITVILILFMIGTFFYPFATDQVYQKAGTNIDAIDINNGLLELKNYLQKNYTTSDYYTLMIPTSSGAVSFTYNNNSSFVDSRGLIATLDPYPLIWLNDSYLAESVENYLSSNNLQNIGGVMTYLHIRYIIFTKNYSNADMYMQESPDGSLYNFTAIYDALSSAFGTPTKLGDYFVFLNPNANPTIEFIRNPIFVNTSLTNYLDFLGSINPLTISNDQKSILYSAIVTDTYHGKNELSIIRVQPSNTYEVPSGNSFLILNNGTVENPNQLGYVSYEGNTTIQPVSLVSLSNRTSYFTNMNLIEGRLFSDYASTIIVNRTISPPSSFNILFNVSNFSYGSRNYFNFQFGNVTVGAQLINLSTNGSPFLLSMTANFYGKGPYAWENIFLPADSAGRKISLSFEDFTGYFITVNVTVASLGFSTAENFYFGWDNYNADPGKNISNFQSRTAFQNQYRFQFNSGGNYPTVIYNFTIVKSPQIRYVFIENKSVSPQIQNTFIRTSLFGNYYLPDATSTNATYLYFFGPPEGTWNAYIQKPSERLPIFEENGFSITYKVPSGSSTYSIQIEYQSLVPQMFEISLAEVMIFLTLLIASFSFQIYRGKKVKKKYRG